MQTENYVMMTILRKLGGSFNCQVTISTVHKKDQLQIVMVEHDIFHCTKRGEGS